MGQWAEEKNGTLAAGRSVTGPLLGEGKTLPFFRTPYTSLMLTCAREMSADIPQEHHIYTSKKVVASYLTLACTIMLGHSTSAVAQQLAVDNDAPVLPQVNVIIVGGNDGAPDSCGTAFLVGRDTWVTATHVIRDCSAVHVRSGGTWRPARAVKAHNSADLAVVEAGQDDRTEALKLSDRNPTLGNPAVHIGFARGEFMSLETRLSAVANVRQASRPDAGPSSGWIWAQPMDVADAVLKDRLISLACRRPSSITTSGRLQQAQQAGDGTLSSEMCWQPCRPKCASP